LLNRGFDALKLKLEPKAVDDDENRQQHVCSTLQIPAKTRQRGGRREGGGIAASVLALSRSASDEGQAERAVWSGRENCCEGLL
jgi:hypothetical protein